MIHECTMAGWMMALCFTTALFILRLLPFSQNLAKTENGKWSIKMQRSSVVPCCNHLHQSLSHPWDFLKLGCLDSRQDSNQQNHRLQWLTDLHDCTDCLTWVQSPLLTEVYQTHWRWSALKIPTIEYSFVFHAAKLTSEVCALQKYVPGKHEWRNY